jgi:hypothetical protein
MHAAAAMLFVIYTAAMSQPAASTDIVQVAQIAIDRLEKADYAAVVALFNPRLREKFPESELHKTWENLHRRSGRLKTTATPITETKDKLRRVIVAAQFEKSKMEIEWVFNNDGLIAELLLHRK